jgi:succinate dehydrogenase/fumarate reductase flavoprotein subunit
MAGTFALDEALSATQSRQHTLTRLDQKSGAGLSDFDYWRKLENEGPIPGLYAAGEITGHFYHKHPLPTSVLRSNTFGRIVGTNVAESFSETAAATG